MSRYLLSFALLGTPALAGPGDYNHMMDWGYGYGVGMMFGPVLWLIVLGLVVAGVIWLVRRTDTATESHSNASAIAMLDMRLAKGELDAEEYSARKRLLVG